MRKSKRLLSLIVIFSLMAGGVLFTRVWAEDDIFSELTPLLQVYRAIRNQYIKKVDPSGLIEGAIRGMIESLQDPHSYWLDPRSYKEMQIEKEGRLGGTGMTIAIKEGFLTVVSCIEGTPASEAGIQPGDKIIRIDGELTEGIGLTEAAEKLRGNPGTQVTIATQREGEKEPRHFTLTRVTYRIPNLKTQLLKKDIGYLKITEFTDKNTAEDVKNALIELQKKGIFSLILDLRDNPGGDLFQSIDVADEFLSSGIIVSTKGRDPSRDRTYYAHSEGEGLKIPLVVLINGKSASASEIVAGAIKDHKKGILLGTRTFGKGTVQWVISLENGGAMGLTTANYYTPSGKCIEKTGIEPNIRVETFRPNEEQKKTLVKLRESKQVKEFLLEHPPWEEKDLIPLMDKLYKEEVQVDEELLKRVLREVDENVDNDVLNDLQLYQAIQILRSLPILKER